MVALWNRADNYIFILWFLSSSSIFFPRLISAVAHWMSTIWRGLSANLECRSEMCWMRLAENTGPKKSSKISHLGIIAQLCRAISSQLRHASKIRKKLVKQQYLLHMSSQYGELRPTNGWDRLAGLGHPIIFQRASRLGSVTARHSSSGRQPNFAALNRGRHLYSAGRSSGWAFAHISSYREIYSVVKSAIVVRDLTIT